MGAASLTQGDGREDGYRGRFAPSPTGPLHFGSLLAALGSWLHARQAGGEWWVRIEDVDRDREIPGAAEAQLETLRRFGLHWEGEVLRQSARGGLYQSALDRLRTHGHVFACSCSRHDLEAASGVHRGDCVAALDPARHAWRFRVDEAASPIAFEDAVCGRFEQHLGREVGDFVLKRADGHWAYQLAVVVDDAAQGITHVVRGADLLDSTPRQMLLQRALGLPTPCYAHLPLVLDEQGRKLSKSWAAMPLDDDDPLPALRAAWAALGQDAASLRGLHRVDAWLRAATSAFVLAHVPTTPARVAAVHNMDATNRA